MSTDRLSERDFDTMLGQALRRSSQAVPADFTGRMLGQVRQLQERKILARIVLEQRLALAGCIGLLAIVILTPMLLSDATAGVVQGQAATFAEQCRTFLDKLPTTIEAVWGRRHFCLALGAALSLAACSLAGLFAGDRGKLLPNSGW